MPGESSMESSRGAGRLSIILLERALIGVQDAS